MICYILQMLHINIITFIYNKDIKKYKIKYGTEMLRNVNKNCYRTSVARNNNLRREIKILMIIEEKVFFDKV